ncbi:MAG: hypothetical protein ACK5D5_07350 [Bacteroidota bacterium]
MYGYIRLSITFLLTSFFLLGFSDKNVRGVIVQGFTAKSGNKYKFYMLGNNHINFSVNRPSKQDENIQLCIAAAFTKDQQVDGIHAVNGRIFNDNKINHSVGGALVISNGKVRFINTKKGKIFSGAYVKKLSKSKSSFFQQLYVIVNGKPEVSKSKKVFQCRGIARLKTGEICIAESEKAITLQTFANDLGEKVQELIYTDMGSWDEGWYKDEKGNSHKMGSIFFDTDKQTNWIYFSKK